MVSYTLLLTLSRQLYVILYKVLDLCYGQNLGLRSSTSDSDWILHILEGQHQLSQWRTKFLPSLGLQIHQDLMTREDVTKMNPRFVVFHRFNIVLSMRYHNLRILLHRPRLESSLEAFWNTGDLFDQDKKIIMQMDIASMQNCVESAVSIVSIIHSITTASPLPSSSSHPSHHELLGAWNYSLYYSK